MNILIFIDKSICKFINHLCEYETKSTLNFHSCHLDSNQWNHPIEKRYDIQESACDIFSNEYRAMIVLGVSPTFYIPVFNGSNDVAFIGRPQLHLNLVSFVCVRVLKKQIQPSPTRLASLFVSKNNITETKYFRILCNDLLNPKFIDLRMALDRNCF